MEKIKIFVDAHSFDTEYQGVRTFIKGIYNVLLQRYSDLDIYFGAADVGQLEKDIPLAGSENIIRYNNTGFTSRFFVEIPSIIKRYGFDYAHFQYIVPFGKKRCRYIVTAHDILFNDFKKDFSAAYRLSRNYMFRRGINMADIKTTVSEYSRQRIAHYYKIDPRQIHVMANGVKENFGLLFSTQHDAAVYIKQKFKVDNYILYVSREEPRKNHVALLQAFLNNRLFEKNYSLVFIGKRSIPVNELRDTLKALSIEQRDHFFWFEQVDQYDLEAFYRGSRLFAYPSKAEGFGIPPLEAAIAQTPVICSGETAMKDFDFFEPYVFNPYQQNDVESKLLAAIENPPDASTLERISREVLSRYSWEKSAEKFYNLIINDRLTL